MAVGTEARYVRRNFSFEMPSGSATRGAKVGGDLASVRGRSMIVVIVVVVVMFGAIALFAGIGIDTLIKEYKQSRQFARLPRQAITSDDESGQRNSRHDWVDYTTLIILYFAFGAAVAAAFEGHRLADATLDTIAHADAAAGIQHADSDHLLKETRESAAKQLAESQAATAQARRQADTTQTAYEEGSRAIIVTSGGIEWKARPEDNKDAIVNIGYNNVGNSSTSVFVKNEIITVTSQGVFALDAIDVGPNLNCDIGYYSVGTLGAFKNGTYHIPVKIDKGYVTAMLANEHRAVIVRGCIFYAAFDKVHYTGFCYVVGQGTRVATPNEAPLCLHGNFAY